tara:strand:+ start:1724 stop:10243 length:8520 start_codon:yes stop_codon:yes gene_type:complete
MAIVQAKAPNSGRYYNIEIAGTTPTPEEKIKIDEYIASVDGPPTGELIESDEGRGFFGALGAGVDTVQLLYGSTVEGIGKDLGIDAIEDIGSGIVETNRQQLQESGANATRLEDVKDIGSGLDFFVETLGEQLPNLATTVAGGIAGKKVGAAIGTAVAPGVGTLIGGGVGLAVGGLSANIPFFFGGNREAQRDADIAAGRPVEIDNRVAFLASIPQASLDLIADYFLVGRFLTPKMIRGGGLFSRGVKGVGAGAIAEVPTEIGQQIIERYQAGQSITSEEALEEYLEVGVAAGLVGGTVKGTVGVVGGDIKKQEKAEATRQLQEDAIEEGGRADARIKAGKVGFDLRQPIEEEAEPEVVAEVSDTNLTDAQKNLSLANAAKQATRPFIPMPLSSFPPEAADYIRQSRQGTSIPLDADVTKEELAKVFNQDVADLAERVQKPDLAAKPASPIFSVKQKEDAKKEIQKRGKVNKGQIKRAIKTDSTEVVDEILRDLETDGVVKHLERGRYVLPEDKRLDPLYKEKEQRDKARAEITRIEALKQEAIRLRDKALEENNPVAAEALNREIENIEATVEQPNTLLAEAEDRIRAKEDAEKAAADERLDKTEREEAEEASKIAMQAESARYRDEYQTKRKKVAARLRQYMRGLGLGDVGLKIDDYIEREGGLKDPNIEGVFDPSKRSISLAMSIYDPSVTDDELYVSLRNVLNHEIIHAIKEIGLFTDAEYKTLVKAATNTKYVAIKQGKGEKRAYTFLDRAIMLNPKDQNLSEAEMQALLEEEAIAEMFRAYADGRLKIVGKPKNLLDRIVKFFKALGGAHFDEGFDSAASIFENIQTQDKTKQLGTRKRGQFTPPKSKDFLYSTQKSTIEPFKSTPERVKSNVAKSQLGISQKLAQASVLHRIDENNNFIDTRVFNEKGKVVAPRVATSLRILQEERGNITLDPLDPKDFKKIVMIMAAEAEAALRGDKNAIGWYEDKVATMFEFMGKIEGGNQQILNDPEARAAFTFAMAVTSNGLSVNQNFVSAMEEYKVWKETGLFKADGYGDKGAAAMRKAFKFYNTLKSDLNMTDVQIQNYLTQETTVRELKKDPLIQELGIQVPSGELQDTKVRVAHVLGAKIGNGFYMNLNGEFDALTMDMWWMRMWNRIIGKPFKQPTDETNNKNRKRIQESLEGDLTEFEQRLVDETMLDEGLDSVEGQNVDQFATALNAKFQRIFTRFGKAEADKRPEKTPLFQAADTHAQNLSGKFEQATPRNGTEREVMRAAAESSRELLKEKTGIDINNADFQALMWYHEKRLLSSMGTQSTGADNDYVDGAIAYARREGFTDDQIAEALPPTDRDRVYPDSGARRPDEGISRESAENDTAANLKYSVSPAKAAAIAVRIGAGDNGRVWRRKRSSREVGQYDVAAEYKVAPYAARLFNEQGVKTPAIFELAQTMRSAQQFAEAIDRAKIAQGPLGSSVYVYPVETTADETGYADMRLFLTRDGKAGFALKEGEIDGLVDIVSVFNTPDAHKGFSYPAIRLAVDEGGNKLDAFDTFLPGAYSANGFTIRSRTAWNDEFAPEGWDKEEYSDFNNGEPDVVFMYYNPKRRFTYKNGDQEGELFLDYDDAVDAQNGAALNPSSVNRQLDINRAETIQLFDNEEATLGEITPEQEQDLRSIMDMMESLPKSTRKFSTAPSNAFATINAPKRFPRFEKYNSLFGIMKENNNLIPVMFFAGNHGVDSSGRAFGFGKYHIQERGHEKEIVENSKFPDVETAVQQLMFAWHKQGHKDGPNVVSFPDGGGGPAVSDAFIPMGKRDLRLEWLRPSHSSPKIVLSLQYGRLQDPEVLSQFGFKNPIGIYSVRTTYPDLKSKKLSRSFSRSTFANVDTGSTNFVANHNNNHISYSAAHNTISKILGLGGLVSEQKARDVSQSFITKFQDTFLPVGVMIDKLKQQGMTITDGMDTYLQETLFHGKTGDILNSKQKEMYEPLARLVKDLEVSDADFSRLTGRGFNSDFEGGNYAAKSFKETGSKRLAIVDAYLYALHAKERNAYIRSINNDLANGSGMTDAEADYILSWVASLDSGNKQIIADVQQRVRQVVDDTNAIRVASGLTPDFNSSEPLVLESGEIVQPPQYENYVPLRGIFDSDGEATEDASYTSPVTSQGYSVRGREDRRALGRQEYATNILAATFLQNQNAVIRSERNKVGLSFLNLLRGDERLTSQFAEELESVPLTRGLVKGAVRTIVDRNALNDPNIITVKEDGKHVYIRVRDQRLANALKGGAGVSTQTSNAVVRGLGKINRYLSNINTSLNPEFMITNMIRDVQTAGVNINQYEQKGLVSEVRRNFLDALSAVKQVVREDANIVDDPSIPVSELTGAALFRRFQRAGGQNATNQISDLSDQVANIKKLTDDIAEQGLKGQWNAVKNSFVGKKTGSMLKFLEDYNTVVENGVRVATFKALAPRIGEQRAAFAARNVTVDFAKGGEYKTLMNSMYLFYNASLQGSFAMLSAAARSKKVRKIWVGLMVAGVLQDQLLAFTSEEDEDGQLMADKIPDYILEHNLVFRDPFGITERSHIVIPMPYGLNMAVNIGRSLSRASRGGYTPAEAADSAMMTMIDTLNPLGGTESFINFVMPTVVDPIIDLYENEDFANKPIYKETSPFDPTPPPDSQLYWSTTSPSAKWIAQWLNSLDGSTVEKGTLDVSPDVIEFWVDYLTGGIGRFVQMSGDFAFSTLPKAVEDGFTDEMIRQVPFGRKVVYSVSEREDLGSFIEKRDRVLQAREVLTDAIRRGDADLIQNTRSKYKDELRIAGIIKSINNGRNSLLRRMAQIKDNPRIPEEQKKKIIERMSKQVDALILRGNIAMKTL